VFEEGVDAGILEDEVLHRIANVRTLVQPFGGRVTEAIRLRDLGKAGNLAAFLHPVPHRVRRELELVSDADAVCFANSLAEDELLVERLPERQLET